MTGGGGSRPGKPFGGFEAVEVGQLNVKQDKIGCELAGALHAGSAVCCFCDLVALVLEQRPSAGAKGRVVIDDEDERHPHIVAP